MSYENYEFKETLTYTKEGDYFVGKLQNIPVVAHAETLEELQNKLKTMGRMWLSFASATIAQENPFVLKEKPIKEFNEGC